MRSQLDDERGTTGAVWDGLAGLGVTGLLVPEAYGGSGAGLVDAAVVLEELGRSVHPGPYASSAIGAVSLVLLAGTDADRAAFLPTLASGERIGTVALSETVQAELVDGTWTLTGSTAHVPDAVAADLLVITAANPGGELGAFVAERGAHGLEVVATPTVDGTRKQGLLTLSATPAQRLGTDADVTEAVAETRDRLVVAAVVDGVGAATRALEIAVEYAMDRRQFDRPIGSFQAVQHLCADMLQAVELSRAGAYYACWAADAADAAERHRAATLALAYAADELYTVGASLIQVCGGIGFTWEHDAHLFYKRLMSLKQFEGGTTNQLEELATLILG